MKSKNKAFTLAETLVVMGIIGVIAALTIPNLSQSTGSREKITKVKKTYAMLSEALERAEAVYGPFDEWFTSTEINNDSTAVDTKIFNRITEFLKTSKLCRTTTDTGCSPWSYANSLLLADGTSVVIMSNGVTADFRVYLDGTRSKGKEGKDFFQFYKSLEGEDAKLQLLPG